MEVAKEAKIKNKRGARGKVSHLFWLMYRSCELMISSQKHGIDDSKGKDSTPGTPSSSTAPAKKPHKKV